MGFDGLRTWLWSERPRLVSGRLQVHVLGAPSDYPAIHAEVNSAGGQVTGGIAAEGLVQAWVPVQAIGHLATRLDEFTIRQPASAHLHAVAEAGSVQTEALGAMGANEWHDAGYFGQGIRVGVIDLGYAGYPGLLGTELPAQVATGNFVDGQEDTDVNTGTRHGTAVAEIIHDVAPAAELYLAKVLTIVDLAEAVDWLLSEGVQVINTSLGWYDVSPGDGTGFFADQVARARAGGILWVTSAGDEAQRHWCGDWLGPQDGELFWFGPDFRMNWLRTETGYEIRAGTRIEVYLRWSDWAAVDQDYDLYLYEFLGETPIAVASSAAGQTGLYGQTPTESLQFITTSAEGYYAVAIKAFNVTRDIHLDLFLVGEPMLHYRVAGQSLSNLADAVGVVSVGAVDWSAPYTRQANSSQGPTKGPGGIAAGGLQQPGLAAYGGVSTASEGVFAVTSSAAPHVAGAAALVSGRYPDWGPDEVVELLYSRARDNVLPLGWDPAYGHGSLYIGEVPFPPLQYLWLPLVAR
jgi:subtilisin family serine protease